MADIRNYRTNYTLSFPDDLKKADSNYPFMVFQIQKFPATLDFVIKDDEKSTAKRDRTVLDYAGSVLDSIGNAIDTSVNKSGVALPTRNGQTVKPSIVSTIQLPITNNVTNALGIDWQMESMPFQTAAIEGLKKVKDIINTTGSTPNSSSVMNMLNRVWEEGSFVKSAATAITSDLLKRTINRIANPKMQALFNGVGARQFTFEYIFTPTNLKEAETIEQIIRMFTAYSLPNISSDLLIMDFPHEYQITFHNVKGFPILHPCVCTGIATNYTPNTLQLLQDGHSTQIVLALSFMETTLKTQQTPGV